MTEINCMGKKKHHIRKERLKTDKRLIATHMKSCFKMLLGSFHNAVAQDVKYFLLK